MAPEKLTLIVFWGLFGALMIYDLVQVIRFGLPATVTQMWWNVSKSHPILVTLFGIFCGHLFPPFDLVLFSGIAVLFLGYCLFLLYRNGAAETLSKLNHNPMAAFFTGYLLGAAFWSEKIY